MHQGADQPQLLAHAAGELGRQAPLEGSQIGKGQELGHSGRPLSPGDPVEVGVKIDVFLDRQVVIEAETLGHVADMLLDALRFLHGIEAQHLGPAAVRVHDAAEQADGGGLAGAVGAHQREGLSGGDGEVQAVNRGQRAEVLCQACGLNCRRLAGAGCLVCCLGCQGR